MNATKAIQIELPAPHAGQRQVLAEAKRFNACVLGRRFGKTTLAVGEVVKAVLQGFPAAWCAPTFKLQMEAWRALQDVLAPVISARSNAEGRLEIRGGGSVTMFSLDGETVADSLRGRAFKLVIVDEAAMVKNLRTVWETAIRPCLADHRGGAWFLSTPRGFNDFKLFYDRGQDDEREDWASWQMPTSSNPHIAAEEIEAARQDMSEAAFSQEFLGEFISWEGAVFRRVAECATAERKDGPEPSHEYCIGVDWGRSTDFTVFVVLDVTASAMVHMDRSNRVDYAVQRGRLQALRDRWRPSRIIAEANSIGQVIIESLERDGIAIEPFTTTNASKAVIVESLALAFERGEIEILDDPVLLGELQAFAAEQLPGGSLRYAAPGGGHDDCVISLALAWSVKATAANAVYGALLTDAVLYEQLPAVPMHSARWIAVSCGAWLTAGLFIDDGVTIHIDNEFVGGSASDPEFASALVAWPVFGEGGQRHWPTVLVPPGREGLRLELLRRGVFTVTVDALADDDIRRPATALFKGKLRINRRCNSILRDMKTFAWDKQRTTSYSPGAELVQLACKRLLSNWRLID